MPRKPLPGSVIEPVPIQDDYCSGLCHIHDVDGNVRIVFYVKQPVLEAGLEEVGVVNRKIVMTYAACVEAAAMWDEFAGRHAPSVAAALQPLPPSPREQRAPALHLVES